MNEYAQYGILGLTIIGLITVVKILWSRLERKEEKYEQERKEDRERHLQEFKKLFEDNTRLTETYSRDSRELGIILKEFEILLKNKNK